MANIILIMWLLISVFASIVYNPIKTLVSSGKKNVYLLSSIGILFLLLILQSNSSNGDLTGYYNHYINYGSISYRSFFDIFFEIKSPVLYLVGKVFYNFNLSFFWWHAFISFMFCYAIYKIISYYSVNYPLSIIIFITLGYYSFAMSGLRQTIALAFVLLSYKYIKEKKIMKFIIFIIIAYCCHNTAVIFLIAYFVCKLKFNFYSIILLISSGLIIYIFSNSVLVFVFKLLKDTNLEGYSNSSTVLTLSGFIIYLCILIFCLFYSKNIQKTKINNVNLILLVIIGVLMRLMSTKLAELFRIAMYFDIFCIISIPEACAAEKKYKKFITLFISFLLFAYYFISRNDNIMNYIFVWQ